MHYDAGTAKYCLHVQGLVRSIGVSNFSIRKLQLLTATARIKPAVCQVEIHPYHRNDDLIRWCAANNIHVTAYSPLGSPDSAQMFKRSAPVLMENKDVQYVAKAVGRNVGQVTYPPLEFH
jgi:diketogulonate reductase-like aldo/keto reductase